MGHNGTTPKQPGNLTLSVDPVRKTRSLMSNPPEIEESPLGHFIEKDAEQERRSVAHIAASDALVRKYGSLIDDYFDL